MTDDPVRAQYEAYPYPERNPADEKARLIVGSPSHPMEIDHFLFGGARDWARPFRVLVAGGGTGDALVMLAQILADHGVAPDILYLDQSAASRRIAEARVTARGLTGIRFETGDLLDAADYGSFDYIDCCGVLHHLPDPDAGFRALRSALAEGGGMGGMVYAPHGRAGVYEMQDALAVLVGGDTPEVQVAHTRRLLGSLPPTNGLKRNPFLTDHAQGGEAGLYDLLLHARDRPYTVNALFDALDGAGLEFMSFAAPGRYDPRLLIADPVLRKRATALPYRAQAALAERLVGNIKTHVFYAAPRKSGQSVAVPAPDAVPCLIGVSGEALAASVRKSGRVRGNVEGVAFESAVPHEAAAILAAMDGVRSLHEIRRHLRWPRQKFDGFFGKLYEPLNDFGLLRFSLLKRAAFRP